MMTLAPIRSAAHAATYFERGDHADYYLMDDVCPSSWEGEGAKILAIQGNEVEPERFKRYLSGEIAGQMIGTHREGEWQHKPGWDLQFSPPKSVSVVALVGKDERVIGAHDQAVREAIAMLEKTAAWTRLNNRNQSGPNQLATGNLLAAVFRHDTSRSLDPQLHSHAVVLNATRKENGQWRSLESHHLYLAQKEAGLAYRQSLAAQLRELGYEIQRMPDANFEVVGVTDASLSEFSKRRDVVDQKLADLGYTRETAPAYMKEKVAHESRAIKKRVEREALYQDWVTRSEGAGMNVARLVEVANERCTDSDWIARCRSDSFDVSQKIFDQAIRSLSERDAVFSEKALQKKMNELAVGYGISAEVVNKTIESGVDEGLLMSDRIVKSYSRHKRQWQQLPAYTTPEHVALEEKMIITMRKAHGKALPEFNLYQVEQVLAVAEVASRAQGYDGWTSGQVGAVRGVLLSDDNIVAIQGYAGTAKTTTALKTIAEQYELKGYDVVGMAPSASACESLAEGAKLDNVKTVASHLLRERHGMREPNRQLWLVDEASLLSTNDMTQLLSQAQATQARVVLVGDVKQLGSVEAGAAFRQLQEHGLQTFKLDEIVRQTNRELLQTVEHSLQGEAREAMETLERGGGEIVEFAGKADARHAAIVKQYIEMPEAQRQSCLIIDPSREGRDQLSQAVRTGLKSIGQISEQEITTQRLERVDLTQACRKDALNYKVGDVVQFLREYKSKEVAKGSYWQVSAVKPSLGVVELQSSTGEQRTWNPLAWGAKSQAYRSKECALAVGDRVICTNNNRDIGLSNGTRGVVKSIDVDRGFAEVEYANGHLATITLEAHGAQHWNYDYVSTVHASQGKTTERVIYHAESVRINLASQKALYVALSRAKEQATVYTDSRQRLIEHIQEHTGEKANALEVQREGPEFDLA